MIETTRIADTVDVTEHLREPRKPTTIMELHNAVRELVPPSVTTFVELKVAVFGHRPNDTDVEVIASAQKNGICKIVEAPTAAEALELFKSQVLPALGLSEAKPAMERLAEMEA